MADWVIVVDDDEANLKIAGHILSKANMRVTAIKSGAKLLNYIRENDMPDLILLDVKMPGMDGFETINELRKMEKGKNIPVIFLTADDNEGTEVKGLSQGAKDYIKKPFVPEILILRVRNTIELDHLQRNLAEEVTKKTKENEKLFMNVVSALASAIDAKDTYTNGHSNRVAEYSREIARRAGYTGKFLQDIYMMGLLHDVGKIGVPDTVINKTDHLTEEEYDIIKVHAVLGYKILSEIKEMPKLAQGAKWHHERYDGKGYPDGLAGENIPVEARIIAVADAYDAMTSNRSYRHPRPQAVVREEIINCSGTQFDPTYAKIMVEMIDEDKDYKLREY